MQFFSQKLDIFKEKHYICYRKRDLVASQLIGKLINEYEMPRHVFFSNGGPHSFGRCFARWITKGKDAQILFFGVSSHPSMRLLSYLGGGRKKKKDELGYFLKYYISVLYIHKFKSIEIQSFKHTLHKYAYNAFSLSSKKHMPYYKPPIMILF